VALRRLGATGDEVSHEGVDVGLGKPLHRQLAEPLT
jgi:hypothetical protein